MNHIKHLAPVVNEPQIRKYICTLKVFSIWYILEKIYAVKYEAEGVSQWYRGKLTDINVKSDTKSRDFNYVVTYIDFGNTKNVKKELWVPKYKILIIIWFSFSV